MTATPDTTVSRYAPCGHRARKFSILLNKKRRVARKVILLLNMAAVSYLLRLTSLQA